jgi:hypothetical protein
VTATHQLAKVDGRPTDLDEGIAVDTSVGRDDGLGRPDHRLPVVAHRWRRGQVAIGRLERRIVFLLRVGLEDGHLVRGEMAISNKRFFEELRDRPGVTLQKVRKMRSATDALELADGFVELRVGKSGLVELVVAEPAVADQVDDDVLAELPVRGGQRGDPARTTASTHLR